MSSSGARRGASPRPLLSGARVAAAGFVCPRKDEARGRGGCILDRACSHESRASALRQGGKGFGDRGRAALVWGCESNRIAIRNRRD